MSNNTKSENFKYLRELISNILKWQIAWFLLLVGFSIADHGYFELFDRQSELKMAIYKAEDELFNSELPITEQNNLALAKSMLDRELAKENVDEAFFRAIGLMLLSIILGAFFPVFLRRTYLKLKSLKFEEGEVTLISFNALFYFSMTLSVITICISFIVAIL